MDGKNCLQMKVLLVSTSDLAGGGAIAAYRLMEDLNKNGVKAKMLVRDKLSSSVTVAQVGTKIPKVMERVQIMSYLRGKLWQADTADFGINITKTDEYKEADIIHLHWINQGMVSLSCLKQMIKDGKRLCGPFTTNGLTWASVTIEATVRRQHVRTVRFYLAI